MRISDWSSDVCSSDLSNDPRKTVESYWPYAPTLYDYIRRAMPFGAPQSLTDDQVYSIVAWLLNQANVWPEDKTLDAAGLRQVKMPNRDGFLAGDPRPDVKPDRSEERRVGKEGDSTGRSRGGAYR